MSMSEEIWFKSPLSLFQQVQIIPSHTQTPTQQFNTMSRMFVVVGSWAWLFRKSWRAVWVTAAAIAVLYYKIRPYIIEQKEHAKVAIAQKIEEEKVVQKYAPTLASLSSNVRDNPTPRGAIVPSLKERIYN